MSDHLGADPGRPTQESSAPAGAATQTPGWERAVLEKLAFAALEEQRAARRWKIISRLSWLAVFLLLVWLASGLGGHGNTTTLRHTALVEIKGEIAVGQLTPAPIRWYPPCAMPSKTMGRRRWCC